MNKPDFSELVATLKGRSSKNVGFQPTKPENFDGARDQKVLDAWLAEMEVLFTCRQVWMAFGRGAYPILLERLCRHMVEDNETRGGEEPWLHLGIL